MGTAHLALHERSWGPLFDACAQLLADPGRGRLVVGLLDVTPPPPARPAVASVRHLAVVTDPADRRIGRLLLCRQYERIAGRPVLPWHLEQDIRRVLDSIAIT